MACRGGGVVKTSQVVVGRWCVWANCVTFTYGPQATSITSTSRTRPTLTCLVTTFSADITAPVPWLVKAPKP